VFDLKIVNAVDAGELTFAMIDHWAERLQKRFEKKRPR
jgi:hypothetical protein